MTSLADLVARSIELRGGLLEVALLGTDDPRQIATRLERFVADQLGEPREASFYRTSVGLVTGLRMADGSSVVLKVHRWNVSLERLRAIYEAQEFLWRRGLPAPRPLARPVAFGRGIATMEELVAGAPPDGTPEDVRLAIARGLRRFVDEARPLRVEPRLGVPLLLRPMDTALWPEPHDLRFDFGATSQGAAWIDERAATAKHRLAEGGGPEVVGHFDWRVENLGFDGASISAIYDWDSVGLAPEAVVVGTCAAHFSCDWSRGEGDPLPSLDDTVAFVRDYETARGEAFSDAEIRQLDAANLWLVAYGARCQHSDQVLYPSDAPPPDTRWLRLLHERGGLGSWLPSRPSRGSAEALGVPRRFDLVIFDCDGVLLDSERLAVRTEVRVLNELGWPITEAEVVERFVGRSEASMRAIVEDRLGRPVDWATEFDAHYRAAFLAELTPVDGVEEMLARLTLPSCVASSSTHDALEFKLSLTVLHERFAGRIFSAEDVAHGKPAPDVFLYAAERLGAAPSRCAVVEDSTSGVTAGLAAGMQVFAYTGGFEDHRGLGDQVVRFDDMRALPSLLQAR